MKEQRINFPDYSTEEQERDVERFKLLEKKYQPHAFILKVDGVYAHLILTGEKPLHKFYDGKDLFETYYELREKFPQHKVKCLMNKGLEDYLRDVRKKEQAIKSRQLKINFER